MADYQDPFAQYLPKEVANGPNPVTAGEAAPAPYKYEDPDSDMKSGDTWKGVKAGVHAGVTAPLMAGARYVAEANGADNLTTIFKNLGISADEYAKENIEEMSPAAQKSMQAALTSPEFWEHPGRAAYLKAVNMTPMLAATLVPATLMSGPIGATAAVGVMNGALSAGQAAEELYKKVDESSDRELREIPFYASLRDMGVSEADARTKYNQQVQGNVPLFNFVIGTMAGVAGPAASLARVAKGGAGVIGAAGRGVAGRAAIGAAEGGGTNVIQGGAQNISVQDALIDNGLQKKFDYPAFGNALTEQLAIGVILGGAGGVASRGPTAAPKPVERTISPSTAPKVETLATGAPSAEESVALAASAGPARAEPPKAPDVTPSEIQTPADPAVQEATAPRAPPPDVVAASERVAEPRSEPIPDALPPEVTTEKPVGAVPPEVAAASERVAEQAPGPRVLRAQDDQARAVEAEAKAAQDAAKPQLVEEGPSKGKNWTKKELAKREADTVSAKTIFDEEGSAEGVLPKTATERADLHDRVTRIVERAEAAGVKLSAIKAYDGTSDHMVYLREAYDLKKTLDKKGAPPARRDEHIMSFLGRERAAKAGDFTIMRAERKAEGDLAKRVNQGGDIQTIAAPAKVEPAVMRADTELANHETELSNSTPEKDAVVTSIKKSATEGGVRGVKAPTETGEVKLKTGKTDTVERAVAASAVRKVELTAAERAKYEITPKVTPKIAEIKERVAAAAKEVAKPTEAQAKAGNYPKGHVSIQGLDIALETRRGMERSGKGADGKPWSVKMPDHYGYIKRTEGADGDHVDVYVGKHPDSKDVFLIDQHDHATGKFDEHKAMIGYKDATDAMAAYEAAFSDGKGFDRIGLIKPMKMDEFKAWLEHGDTKKPAAEIKTEAMAHARDRSEVIDHKNGPIQALHTLTVKEIVKGLDFSHLTGASERLIPFLTGRLHAVTKDMKVHVVDPREMAKFTGKATNEDGSPRQGPLGIYVPDNVKGEKGDYLAISSDRLRNSEDVAHTLVHEMVHGAMARAINASAEHRAEIRHLMNEVQSALTDRSEHGILPRFARYAFKDEHEFLAEAFSNPDFQQLLAELPLSPYSAERIGLGAKVKPNMWDFFLSSVRRVMRGLGIPDGQFSALEGAIKVGRRVLDDVKYRQDPMDPANVQPHTQREMTAADVKERGRDMATNAGGTLRAIKDKLSSTIMLGERAEKTTLPGASKVVELKAMMEREKSRIFDKEGGTQLIRDIAGYERDHGTEAFNKMAGLGFEASNSNVNLGGHANEHLGKDATGGWQAKKRLPEMERRFAALPAEGQALLKRTAEFFRSIQNDISLQLIKNIVEKTGVTAPGLAERIHRDGTTDADKALFKTNGVLNALNEAREIKELKGWYLPFRRYGDHVVNAYHEVKAPANGLKIAPDTVQFTDPKGGDTAARRLAQSYVEGHDLTHVGTQKVWVDKNYPTKIIEAEQADAVPAYRVKLQRQSTEFFDNEAMARRVQDNLVANAKDMGLEQVDGVRRREDFVGKGADQLSGHMHTVLAALEKQDRFKSMSSAEKAAVRQTLNEASVRVLGSTRLQASFQQRRNVAGYSGELGRVTADYTKAATGYLGKLRFQPRIDDAFAELQKYTDAHKYESNDKTIRRDELMSELRKRIYGEPGTDSQSAFGRATRRLLQISRLDKLAGVSFHVINAQEPWTTSLPVIGGRHGFVSAARTLGETYNLIGARAGVMSSLRDTVKAFSKDNGFTDYLATFKDEINRSHAVGGAKAKRLNEALDYADTRGIFNDDAIFEVAKYADPTKGALLRGLDRADLMANQTGNAIEKINRTVTLLTAYELEFKKTGNHEASIHYAYEVTHDTMGDYSSWNASPLFKGNAGMLALQFKKFAHKTYYLLGNTLRGTIQGDPEAAKQFVGLMVTHGIVAGAMGLPLEPFKVALLAGNALGVTGFTWQDFELIVRTRSAEVLGQKGGEMFSHGLTRGLGIDTSTRQGMDSLLTFGAPQDASKAKDLKAWLFDTAAGAPAGYILDQIKSAQALAKGDVMKAVELTVPIKGVTDVIKVGTGLSPKLDAKGKVTRPGYTPFEAGVRAIGFTPASEAENYEKRTMAANSTREQGDKRSTLINNWVVAKPADKASAFKAVQDWNKDQPAAVRVKGQDLTSAASKRKKLGDDGHLVRTKQNSHILDKLTPVYGAP
jgi:hypothetical protein